MFACVLQFVEKYDTRITKMTFNTYDELVGYINTFSTQKEKLDIIIQYFIDNVKFDYVMLEHINRIVTTRFTDYIDRQFPGNSDKSRFKALSLLKNSTNISNDYWDRIKILYMPDNKNSRETSSLTNSLNKIMPDVKYNNNLLTKGIAVNITKFAKQICDDVGINCLIVNGISSGKTEHYWLDIMIDDTELFYDIAYTLYIRDNFCNMGKRYKIDNWLGITPKQLYKNQPTRTILNPKGFNLENLGLNNIALCMKDFFDTTA